MNETIVLGGGCFWCIEAFFQDIKGVVSVVSGYAGGHTSNPTYKLVCSETTGHAEVVKITFDKNQISLRDILEIFFVMHDPTTLNRQGNDVGHSYRSIVLFQNQQQQNQIKDYINEIQPDFKNPIVTEVKELNRFYPAEDYHQNYYKNNPDQGYCNFVISPKMSKLRQKFADKL